MSHALSGLSGLNAIVNSGPPPTLSDNFDDNVTDSAKWAVYNGFGGHIVVSESSGKLNIACNGAASYVENGGYTTKNPHNFSADKTITVKLVSLSGMGQGAGLRFVLVNPTTNAQPEQQAQAGFTVGEGFYADDGRMHVCRYDPNTGWASMSGGFNYNGVTVWLRIHYNSGTGQFEFSYSYDNSLWTLLTSWTPNAAIVPSGTYLRLHIGSGAGGNYQAAGAFDDLVTDAA
jgi:hypothetical protein